MTGKRFVISSVIGITSLLSVFGQTWSEVKESKDYFFGEGWGSTVEEANREALKNLVEQFKVNVSIITGQKHERNEKDGKLESDRLSFRASIETFSQATLDSTIMLIISPAPNAHVGRWIKKTEVDKIFNGRRQKIHSLIEQGERAVEKGKVDVALRCFYWAFTLVKSLPNSNSEKYNGHLLITWLPEMIDEVLSDIRTGIAKINNNDVELNFTYKGKPVNSIDYVYNDGGMWSNICSAKDGVGMIFMSPGSSLENINLQIEYEYRGQAMLDPEIQSVLRLVPEYNISRSFITANNGSPALKQQPQTTAKTNSFTEIEEQFFEKPKPLTNAGQFYEGIQKVVDAIRTNSYETVRHLFTPNGYSVFNKLVRYGQAKVVGNGKYEFTSNNGATYGRGLQLSFSFRNGVRRNFVEDIVFKFNKDNLIDNVSFGLGATTLDDILAQSAYPENIRILLVEFLENYQTAFALKRLDYISTIFDEDAIIIVGNEARKQTGSLENRFNIQDNKFIQYNRYDKATYLDKLERSFKSKEYINLRFNSTQVRKALNGGELYGIQIEQDYYSSNYGDHGYLFLEINMNNPDNPLILVRTWQPQPDPQFGLYNETLFPVHSFE